MSNDPLTDDHIEQAKGRAKAFYDSDDNTDPAKHGNSDHPNDGVPPDEKDEHGNPKPPKGWHKDAAGSWAPSGWTKHLDTWVEA